MFLDKQFISKILKTVRNTNFSFNSHNIMSFINQNSRNQRTKANKKLYGIKHDFLHFLKGMVFPFDNPNLLERNGSRKLMSNPFRSSEKVEVRILKFFAMLTLNVNDPANFFSLFTFQTVAKSLKKKEGNKLLMNKLKFGVDIIIVKDIHLFSKISSCMGPNKIHMK